MPEKADEMPLRGLSLGAYKIDMVATHSQKGRKMDKYIAKQIILAQIASDGGKEQDDVLIRISFLLPITKIYNKKAYNAKDYCIIEAIKAIQKNPNSGFYYHVKVDRTLRSGAHVFVVYFDFKIKNERYQISFHTFSNMWRFVNKKCVTRWKKKHSSKESAIKLAHYIFSNTVPETIA